jgi:radical SAM superfamily enzyme YgiQ (UPF0313 family)
MKGNPDVVAFSVVYSSQAFYCLALAKELKKSGVKVYIGGPAVTDSLRKIAVVLSNEYELLTEVSGKKEWECDYQVDYSMFGGKYFAPEIVYPLRTSSSCFYRQCSFCNHHKHGAYLEYPIENLRKTIMGLGRHVFLTDDMIPRTRLLELASILKGKSWMCQLKPTADYDIDTLRTLKQNGLDIIIWGVESSSDRVLAKMRKGTNAHYIAKVLRLSHEAGIRNVVYIMFGFPTETKEELMQTVEFLEENKECIDLVSTSVFGIQKGTHVYENPSLYGITIKESKRTVLDSKVEYTTTGMDRMAVRDIQKKLQSRIEKLNKFPKMMNFFREHMLLTK